MSSTTIFLSTDKQKLEQDFLEDFIASDAMNYHEVSFTYDTAWDGTSKFAFFTTDIYNLNDDTISVTPVIDNVAKIPEKILMHRGDFWIGTFGFDAAQNMRITSDLLHFNKVQGAFVSDFNEESLPIWQQVYHSLITQLDNDFITDMTLGDTSDLSRVFLRSVKRNAATGNVIEDSRYLELPHASDNNSGVMTIEQVNTLANVNDRLSALEQAGLWRGTVETHADLASIVTTHFSPNDFVYVRSDETRNGRTTKWIWNGTQFNFHLVVTGDGAVQLATNASAGVVRGTAANVAIPTEVAGFVGVNDQGAMFLNGWNTIHNHIRNIGAHVITFAEGVFDANTHGNAFPRGLSYTISVSGDGFPFANAIVKTVRLSSFACTQEISAWAERSITLIRHWRSDLRWSSWVKAAGDIDTGWVLIDRGADPVITGTIRARRIGDIVQIEGSVSAPAGIFTNHNTAFSLFMQTNGITAPLLPEIFRPTMGNVAWETSNAAAVGGIRRVGGFQVQTSGNIFMRNVRLLSGALLPITNGSAEMNVSNNYMVSSPQSLPV